MIVTREQVDDVLLRLSESPRLSLDTETTGLRPHHGDRLFSIIISDGIESYYFNFQEYPGAHADLVLERSIIRNQMAYHLFSDPRRTWYLHNAKFDAAFLSLEGGVLVGPTHCTLAVARIEYNGHMTYDLGACASRIGLSKSEAVEEYIDEHGLYEMIDIPGKPKKFKNKFFHKVPLDVIGPYGCTDALVTYKLGEHQVRTLSELAASTPEGVPSILQVVENEKELTKTCLAMEQAGMPVDKRYCAEAFAYEHGLYKGAIQSFEKLTGIPFKDSNKTLAQAFSLLGESYPLTEKGNPSFKDEVLCKLKSPAAKVVQTYRGAYKNAHTYYANYLHFVDSRGLIHATMKQGGTATGRFSYADPNLQNIPKEDEENEPSAFPVRRAFIPLNDEYCLVMMDYDQMELRLMLDYAGQIDLIEKIKAGLEPHQATADLVGCTRRGAKVVTFGLIYGMGVDLLATTLGIAHNDAYVLRSQYFQALPRVKLLIRTIMQTAEQRGHIFNWYGRRFYFPDAAFAYKAPNYLIQGGTADIIKIAMNRIAAFFREHKAKSHLALQVHDELIFQWHRDEFHLIPGVKAILENVYPARYLPLTCGVEHSFKSWADKVEGVPIG